MPKKNADSATPQDLDTGIQIALDAADAAMDVTVEFSRLSKDFSKMRDSAVKTEKTARIILGVGTGIALVAIVLIALLWNGTSRKLEVLAATNTELLTIFTENIDEMNEGLTRLGEAFEIMETVASELEGLDEIGPSIETKISQQQTEFDAANARIVTELGDRLATLNGELAMTLATDIDEMLGNQNQAMVALAKDMTAVLSASLEVRPSEDDSEEVKSLRAAQGQLETRIRELTTRLETARQRAANAQRPPQPQQPTGDVIKFP
jgi:phage shock protein A